jgi:hypothetical protein
MSNDINDLTAMEANAIISAVKIVKQAIESGQLDMPEKDRFHGLLKSSYEKLTHKDDGVIQRIS